MAQQQTGLTSNSRGVFDALHYTAGQVEVITGTEYMNGCALRSYDVYQTMLTTDILPMGSLEGNIIIKVYWTTNDTSNATVAQLVITDSDNVITKLEIPTRAGTLDSGTRLTFNFNPTKSYTIEFKTTGDLASNKYVILNYLRIDQLHSTAALNATLYSDTSDIEPINLTQQGVGTINKVTTTAGLGVVPFPISYDIGTTPSVQVTLLSDPYFNYSITKVNVPAHTIMTVNYYLSTPIMPDTLEFSWSSTGNKTPPISENDHVTYGDEE
jgi:hypothetical protein